MMSPRRATLAVLAAVALLCAGCGAARGEDVLTVGIIAPLSGALAEDGTAYTNAAKAALAEGERALGRRIEVIVYDEASRTGEAINGTRRLLQRDRAHALLSSSTSGNFLATRQLIDRAQVPVLTIATATTVVKNNAGWTFRVSQPLADRNRDNAAFAVAQLKARTAAFLQTNDESQRAFAADVGAQLRSAGVNVVSEQYFQYGDTDFSPYLQRLRASAPEVVFLGCEVTQCATILDQSRAAGVSTNFVLPTAAASEEFLHQFGAVAEGAYAQTIYAPGATPATAGFERLATANGFPASYYSMVGYVEAHALLAAVRQAGSLDPQAIRRALATGGFDSPLGPIRFRPDGQAVVRGYVAQITGSHYRYFWAPSAPG
ncbi:MAG: ABC transporter substrate-binding protein [Pseudonocardia sp.]|nr:ABC transporter substrate-binding protein [Pseudonocardia sp.]